MKLIALYLGLFCIVTSTVAVLLIVPDDPEQMLTGKWREVSWEYERLDQPGGRDMADDVRERVGKTLVIHKSEYWEFFPDRTVALMHKNGARKVKWRLTGRANVLRLEYDRKIVEHYNITRLSPETLVLNFETDIQARGIAKLTFQKLNSRTE